MGSEIPIDEGNKFEPGPHHVDGFIPSNLSRRSLEI